MNELLQLNKQEYTLIGKNSRHKGDFSFSGTTYISGVIEGQISLIPDYEIFINHTGNVKGTITCGDITIKGIFSGEIKASGSVIIETSAQVDGIIDAKNLVISPGAVVNIKGSAQE